MCGVRFGITEELWEHRQEDSRAVICPNGHTVWFTLTKESQWRDRVACVRKEVRRYKKLYDQEHYYAELFRRSNIALRAVITRMKNKAKKESPGE